MALGKKNFINVLYCPRTEKQIETHMKSDGHVTIEKTAKKYKLVILLSALCAVVSIFWIICACVHSDVTNSEPSLGLPILLLLVSGLVYIVTKIAIWWNHG